MLSLGKKIWLYIICVYGKRIGLAWGEGDSVVAKFSIQRYDCHLWSWQALYTTLLILFFLFPFEYMELLTTETLSNTLSLKLFKLFKPPVHITPSWSGKGKPQHSDQKDGWTVRRCHDCAEPWFPPSAVLQKNAGYRQSTTVLVDALETLRKYNSVLRKKKPKKIMLTLIPQQKIDSCSKATESCYLVSQKILYNKIIYDS